MTRIDPVRLSEIFRALKTNNNVTTSKPHTSNKTIDKDDLVNTRSEEVLRARLISKLAPLKENSTAFLEAAPFVAIQEIMGWEFGEQIINHPEFKNILQAIVSSIKNSPQLSKHMNDMMISLTEHQANK